MPHITEEERQYTDHHGPDNAGQLAYVLTKVLLFYVKKKGISTKAFAEVMGALEYAKHEWYEKMIRPFEEIKEKENGGIYPTIESGKIDIPSKSILTP